MVVGGGRGGSEGGGRWVSHCVLGLEVAVVG